MKNKFKRSIAKMLCLTTCVTAMATPLIGCGGKNVPALVLATDALDTVFNPFFYTSGADGEIVGQTQIGMVSSNEKGDLVAGWDEPCVSLAWGYEKHGSKSDWDGRYDYGNYKTDYYYALKDDIKFSDGTPLTKDDVLFNMYMYLDPAYTGSNTLYSVKIRGLTQYRTQTADLSQSGKLDIDLQNAIDGRMTAIVRWCAKATNATWSDASFDLCDYKGDDENTLESDINKVLTYYKDSLSDIWTMAISADIEKEYAKYKGQDGKNVISEPWQLFLYYNNLFNIREHRDLQDNIDYYESDHSFPTKDIPKKAKDRTGEKFKKKLIDYVYNNLFFVPPTAGENRTDAFKNNVVSTMNNNYTVYANFSDYLLADAKYRKFKDNMSVEKVSGIEIVQMSKIPCTDESDVVSEITLTDKEGNPKTYDVLHITIDGVDPKAKQNFAFTVAPGHYYSTKEEWAKAIGDNGEDNKFFGVKFSDPDFMDTVRVKQLPLGAGPFRAAKSAGGVAKTKSQFFGSNNIVNFEANPNFLLGKPKIQRLRYKVISNSQLYNAVNTGEVDYASPSMKNEDINELWTNKKVNSASAQNLGYGYIGISAKYIPNIYIRKGIMTTFDADSAVNYYGSNGGSRILRPMSKTLTDYYPKGEVEEYYPFDETGQSAADWFKLGGCEYSSKDKVWKDDKGKVMKYTFTIAGDSDDHPANGMLVRSAKILNDMGLDITVTHDSTALSKLSAGLLTVWAAAWSSSSDPDMYQVYHKDSQATSISAWGYRYLLSSKYTGLTKNPRNFDQVKMIEDLSELIDKGRETDVYADRYEIYSGKGGALDKLMDLAVEFPTYQRKVFYVWRKGVFNEKTLETNVTSYQSPLSKIWEVEIVKK